PGSSLNGIFDALDKEQETMKYIQVRHEQGGALAASAHYKLTKKIGAAFGSGGPGGTNLINGLYDAKMDRVPMLAIYGQTASTNINTTFFQELDQSPIFADVAVFNKRAVNAEQIPNLIEEAIRTAYSKKGPAVVILPTDMVETEIDYIPRKEKRYIPKLQNPVIETNDMDVVLNMIKEAKNPVLYLGQGVFDAKDIVGEVSDKFKMPIVTSVLGIGVAIENNHENFMGSFGRLGFKSAYDVIYNADLLLFVGANMPFARYWPEALKIIQVNNEIADIGKQVDVEIGIVADSKDFLKRLLDYDYSVEHRPFLDAARLSKKYWDEWLENLSIDESKGLSGEAVIKEISKMATDDAIFGLDVGNNTMHSIRTLPFDQQQQFTISAWFATLGYGVPASIDAKITYPNKQVWSISGDGGFAMNMQEIITQSKYQLPIINIVLNDQNYGFIKHAQLNSDFEFGVDIEEVDWAKTAEGMGAIGFSVSTFAELKTTFVTIKELQDNGNTRPIVVDAKIRYRDPIDTSVVHIDPKIYSSKVINEYKDRYDAHDLTSFSEILEEVKNRK
ncbi:MAG: pyruvate oxidase, partial [Erysipelothrix sp.]|nr:pyruvate oxidase [Erysipelothrix sp.]